MKTYIVCIDSCYVRDAQIFQTGKYSEKKLKRIDIHNKNEEQNWKEAEITPFIDVVQAMNEHAACSIVANRFHYDKKCLYATEINFSNKRKDELFDKLIAHIQECGTASDIVESFRGIGFTEDELINYEVLSDRRVKFRNLLEEAFDDICDGILLEDETIACLCGCQGTFEKEDYEIITEEKE